MILVGYKHTAVVLVVFTEQRGVEKGVRRASAGAQD